jgi:hypothetical protein
VSRAITAAESVGVPAVGIVCHGFAATVRSVARAEGLNATRLVDVPPPNIAVHGPAEVNRLAESLIGRVIDAFTSEAQAPTVAAPAPAPRAAAPKGPRDIVFSGDLEAVNDHFIGNVWSDGLPIVPPTIDRVEAMLARAGRPPDDVIGVLKPKNLQATVWKIAVNAVMAGCRPEYMPVVLAVIEAIAEPRFGLEHAGSTAGWTPLILLNGPIIKELGFTSGQGVMLPQTQANMTVSRCLRLCMVNIAGYRLGETDMASFGRNYYPVLAEAEDLSPWPPSSTDRGFAAGEDVVTVQSADVISHSFLSVGEAEQQLKHIAMEVARELGGSILYHMEHFGGEVSPIICLSPLVANILAKAGYSKDDVRRYLFDNARVPAWQFDDRLNRSQSGLNLHTAVKEGRLAAMFAESDDPNRLVPVVHKPEEFHIVVAGSPDRNRNFIAGQIGEQGLNVSKRIRRPQPKSPP